MEDERIIELYWARSEQAIAESERKYGAHCRAIARNILNRAQDEEECVNDTWLRAWNAMPPQRPAVLRAFFGRLTRNLALDRWRRDRAAKRGGGAPEVALEELRECLSAPEGRPEEEAEAARLGELISRFLRSLPKEDRQLFVRRYWYLDSTGALAGRFGRGEGWVKTRLYRLRRKLRDYLEEEGIRV